VTDEFEAAEALQKVYRKQGEGIEHAFRSSANGGIRRNVTRWLICGAAAAFVAAGAPAWSQSTPDAQALKLYGGAYSSDCSNSTAPRLRVVADALMVEQGTKRMTGHNVQAAYSYFGQSPPPAVASELDRLWMAEWRQKR
jgi:hypothetical protein